MLTTLRALSILCLIAAGCGDLSLAKSGAPVLEVKTYVASAAGFHVTSNLIVGETEAVLVDAQFTRSEATKLAAMIRGTGKKLTTIFISHGHPDHYFGVEILAKEFPDAQVVTTAEALKDIQETGAAKLAQWKPMYKDDLTDAVPVIGLLSTKGIMVDRQPLRIVELGGGESAHASAVYIPQIKTVISGDAQFDRVHLWLAEGNLAGFKANLKQLEGLGAKRFLPGHSVDGKEITRKLLTENRRYVEDFSRAITAAATSSEAAQVMKVKYPAYALPVIVDISAQAVMGSK